MKLLPPVQKFGAPALLSAQKPVSATKLAFRPPPRSSTPRKPRREPPDTPDETRSDLAPEGFVPATEPESCTTPTSTLPYTVTDDWAEAAVAKAPSTARASRDFFIATIF